MTRTYRIENIKAISINRAYPSNGQGKRFLCKEGSDFKKRIMTEFAVIDMTTYKTKLTKHFAYSVKIVYEYVENELFIKNRVALKKKDIDNLIKFVVDGYFNYINQDDKKVIELVVLERLSTNSYNNIIFEVTGYEKDKAIQILSTQCE